MHDVRWHVTSKITMVDSLEQRIKKILLSTLKCPTCQNFLSVVSKDGGRLRCEVCKDVPGETLSRSAAFMKIAQELSFPCVHVGCTASVPWNEVRKHEEICDERSVKCPLNYKCEFVKIKKLVEHLQNTHKCNVFLDTLTHKLDETINQVISVLTFKNHIFLVLTRGVPKFEIFIIMLNNSRNTGMSFTYNVRLSSESNDSIVLFENQQISSWIEGKYCLPCWLQKCSVHSANIGFDHPLDFSCLKQSFGIQSVNGIKYSIEIVALENIAQELSLPCNHEGCEALVPWNEVRKHEEICDEKLFRCPFNGSECGFLKMKELVEHLKNIHGCNAFFDKLDATVKREISVVIFKNHIFFVLIISKDDTNFEIFVTMLNYSKNRDMSFTYNVRLSNESNDSIVLFENQQIDSLEEGKYCLNCSFKMCRYHPRTQMRFKCPENLIKTINLSHTRTLFRINSTIVIRYSIEIVDISKSIGEKPANDIS